MQSSIRIVLIAALVVVSASAAFAQQTIFPTRVDVPNTDGPKNRDKPRDEAAAERVAADHGIDDIGQWFTSFAAGYTPGAAKFELESKVFNFRLLGPVRKRADGTFYKTVIGEVQLSTRLIDALGDSLRAIREYLYSKKGSPLTLNYTVQTLGGFQLGYPDVDTVPGSWAQGRGFFDARLYPVRDSSGTLVANGSVGAGYTAGINIEMEVGRTGDTVPKIIRFYAEASLMGHALMGEQLVGAVDSSLHRSFGFAASLDYRAGVTIDRSSNITIGVVGMVAISKHTGFSHSLQFIYGQDLQSFASAFGIK